MTLRRWLPAAGLGLALLLGAATASAAVARVARQERRDALTTAAELEATRIVSTLEQLIAELERLAVLADDAASFRRAAQPRVPALDGLDAIALATRQGAGLVVETVVPTDSAGLVTGDDLLAREGMRNVLERAVLEADASAGATFTADGVELFAVAAPIVADPLGSEGERRAGVTGAVVATFHVDALFGHWPGPEQLVGPTGRSFGGHAEGTWLDASLPIAGRPFRLLLDEPRQPWPATAWVVLGAGSVLSLAAASALHAQLQRRRAAEAQATERTRQLGRIADAGARLQQSLDLSELLPAFAVSLADDFDLRGASIEVLDEDGSLSQAFTTGEIGEGPPLQIPLRRGWRAVGMLSVRPGRPLDEAELTSLQALGDLLAVAMSNALLYEREQANAARLRDLDALKNAFLGTVSHELRTSMTAIMGFGELLHDAWDTLDDERRREMANRIRRSAGSLRHLVDDLLDFARLEQERLRVSPRNVDLAGVVRQTIESLSPLLVRHELALRLPARATAWADPVAIERILANLVSNAAKYSPYGTTITVAVETIGSVSRLVVADQGPGIPPEERVRIFARFYRLDTPEAVRSRGAGIGLAILRDFADRSGALVTVDDNPGGGARFTVDFPTEPISIDSEESSVAVAT